MEIDKSKEYEDHARDGRGVRRLKIRKERIKTWRESFMKKEV